VKGMMIVNFKTYEEGTGKRGIELASVIEEVSKGGGTEIAIAVQPTDIRTLAENVHIPIFSQHVDPITYGKHTGWILPESVKEAGAKGTLLNHSERRISFEIIKRSIERCREIGLQTVVCADTPETVKKIARLEPDLIAIEPPELIGGEVPVSKAKPELIIRSVEEARPFGIPVLCGAGIKTGEDVRKAKELGVRGIIVASGVVKSENPKEAIKNLLEGFG